jgi:cytochrome P450
VGKTRLVEESDIPNLPYLRAVVKETLRECRQNCRIKGFDIPKKTAVAINLYAIMRDKDSTDDPNKFRPENVLGFLQRSKWSEYGEKFNFVPFGAGRRGCPGTTLAFSLMNAAVAALVQCFDWKVDRDEGKC